MNPANCLVINPIDLSMMFLTVCFVFVRLRYLNETLTYEDSIVILEIVVFIVIKVYGLIADMISINLFKKEMLLTIMMKDLKTEVLLAKNYQFNQLILPYLFVFCGVLIRLDDLRKKTKVQMSETNGNGQHKCNIEGKNNNTANHSDVVGENLENE